MSNKEQEALIFIERRKPIIIGERLEQFNFEKVNCSNLGFVRKSQPRGALRQALLAVKRASQAQVEYAYNSQIGPKRRSMQDMEALMNSIAWSDCQENDKGYQEYLKEFRNNSGTDLGSTSSNDK
jgi:hypothetical protein